MAVINPVGAALPIVAAFEGFVPKAYRDGGGVWTIGYGLTEAAGLGIKIESGRTISESHARLYLRTALEKFWSDISPYIRGRYTEKQAAAMLSLAYNIGPNAFRRSSVLRLFNLGNVQAAADAFLLWNKDNGRVVPGLTNRRKKERDLFLQYLSPSDKEPIK